MGANSFLPLAGNPGIRKTKAKTKTKARKNPIVTRKMPDGTWVRGLKTASGRFVPEGLTQVPVRKLFPTKGDKLVSGIRAAGREGSVKRVSASKAAPAMRRGKRKSPLDYLKSMKVAITSATKIYDTVGDARQSPVAGVIYVPVRGAHVTRHYLVRSARATPPSGYTVHRTKTNVNGYTDALMKSKHRMVKAKGASRATLPKGSVTGAFKLAGLNPRRRNAPMARAEAAVLRRIARKHGF